MPNEIEDVLDLDLNKIAAYDNPDELPASKKATASSVKSEKPKRHVFASNSAKVKSNKSFASLFK